MFPPDILQDNIADLKVQLQQQQQAATDAAQQLSAKEEELTQLKATSSNELQAWQSKIEELKTVSAAGLLVNIAFVSHQGVHAPACMRFRRTAAYWLCDKTLTVGTAVLHQQHMDVNRRLNLRGWGLYHDTQQPTPHHLPHTAACALLQAHQSALAEVQSQLDQAYNDLSELQFSSDQDKVALEAQLQQAQEQLKVRHTTAAGSFVLATCMLQKVVRGAAAPCLANADNAPAGQAPPQKVALDCSLVAGITQPLSTDVIASAYDPASCCTVIW